MGGMAALKTGQEKSVVRPVIKELKTACRRLQGSKKIAHTSREYYLGHSCFSLNIPGASSLYIFCVCEFMNFSLLFIFYFLW